MSGSDSSPTTHLLDAEQYGLHKKLGFFVGPLLCVLLLMLPVPLGMPEAAWRVAAVASWMVIWWLLEPVPLAVTSFLPIVLFPLLHINAVKLAAAPYASPMIYLFLGGFILALAMEKWRLHLRVALNIVGRMGNSADAIIGGFMLATCLLSMWISNTATMMMMYPIAISSIHVLREHFKSDNDASFHAFATALMIGIAYAANIGGVATLIGTPTNTVLSGYMEEVYGIHINFLQWMQVGVPLSLVMLVICWVLLVKVLFPSNLARLEMEQDFVHKQLQELGSVRYPEAMVILLCSVTALLWMTHGLINEALPGLELNETSIAIAAALALFLIPVDWKNGEFLMSWRDTARLPWGTLILFGGGLSLAAAFNYTGLAEWIGLKFSGFNGLSLFALVLVIVTAIIFVSEVMGNAAVITTFLPVLGSLSMALHINPLLLMIPATLAASYAFMLPVGTPPNAIAFGSGYVRSPEMMRAGFVMNLVAVGLIMVVTYAIGLPVFDIDPAQMPDWAIGVEP